VNPTFNNDIFFVGQAIPVDSNLENGGHGNTDSTLSLSTNSSDSTLEFQWQWGAAVYTSWPGNAAANIEPVHATQQAGAPLNPAVEKDLIQGPRGGGGSNFTGSWSGTGVESVLSNREPGKPASPHGAARRLSDFSGFRADGGQLGPLPPLRQSLPTLRLKDGGILD